MPPKFIPARTSNKRSISSAIGAFMLIAIGSFIAGRISSHDDSTQAVNPSVEGSPRKIRSHSNNGELSTQTGRPNLRPTSGANGNSNTSNQPQKKQTKSERLASINRINDPIERAREMLAFIDSLSPSDFEATYKNIVDLGISSSHTNQHEYTQFLSAWAKVDPLAALSETAGKGHLGRLSVKAILQTWASIDPDAAIQWTVANHEGDGANPYMADIIRSVATIDMQHASELLTSMPISSERATALNGFMQQLISKGPDATRDWIDNLSDQSLRSGALRMAAPFLAETDPSGTVDLLLANDSEATRRKIDDVYMVWAKQDQNAAIRSLSNLPNTSDRANGLLGIIRTTAESNPQETATLIDRFSGDMTDSMIHRVISETSSTAPALAIQQIARLPRENQRNSQYLKILFQWRQRDLAAANDWIKSNPLPPSVLERLNRN